MISDLPGQPAPPPPQPPIGGNDGLMAKLLGSVVMIAAFLYGVWCSVGVVMGLGLDRAVTVVEQLFSSEEDKDEDLETVQVTISDEPSKSSNPEAIPCPE